MFLPTWVRRRNGIVVVLAAMALVVSGGVALAQDGDQAKKMKADSRQQLTVNTTGGVCKTGFDTQTDTIYPPDDSVSNNPAAGNVVMTKACGGAVAVTFSSETTTPASGDFIDLEFRATCTGTGGYSSHCTVGKTKDGSPGHINFAVYHSNSNSESHAYTQVFSGLKRGKWKFEVLPGSNGTLTAAVRWRTTMVQAFNGG
jgi:hypothetical protein